MHLTEYRGFQIEVNSAGVFSTKYGEGEYEGYSSAKLEDLKQRLDQFLNRKAKTRKLSLPVVLPTGQKATATGIHLSNGRVLGLHEDAYNFYPDVDWIVASLDRLQLLRAEADRVSKRMQPYQISTRRGNAAKSDTPEGYAAAIDKLEQEYAEKKAAALKDENVEESC